MTISLRGTDYGGTRGSPTSGSDDDGQGRQLYVLPPRRLFTFDSGLFPGVIGAVSFRVEIPDSRLRTNIAIVARQPNGSVASPAACIGTKGLTLWLRAVEDTIQGGIEVPITNLWGRSAAPGAIPGYIDPAGLIVNDPNLGGWAIELVTAGRAVVGTVNYPAPVGLPTCQLWIQVRHTPEGIRYTRTEWAEIKSQASAELVGLALNAH